MKREDWPVSWFVLFVWFIWLDQTDQMNQINPPPSLTSPVLPSSPLTQNPELKTQNFPVHLTCPVFHASLVSRALPLRYPWPKIA